MRDRFRRGFTRNSVMKLIEGSLSVVISKFFFWNRGSSVQHTQLPLTYVFYLFLFLVLSQSLRKKGDGVDRRKRNALKTVEGAKELQSQLVVYPTVSFCGLVTLLLLEQE